MNIYCRKIQFPVEIELENFPPKDYENRVFMIRPPWSKINKKLHRELGKLGLYIEHSEIFYSPPQEGIYIHVDTNTFSNMTKLNFCICNPLSVMNWFEIKEEYKNKSPKETMLSTKYLKYDKHEVKKILHTECIAGWHIVNAGIPHNSTNYTDEPRWTLSYVIKKQMAKEFLEFEEAVEIFKDYII